MLIAYEKDPPNGESDGLSHVATFRDYVETGGLMSYGPTSRFCSGAPATMSTRLCTGRSRVISRSNSRPRRSRRQPDHSKGPRSQNPAGAARPRQRGDRIGAALLRLLTAGYGTTLTISRMQQRWSGIWG